MLITHRRNFALEYFCSTRNVLWATKVFVGLKSGFQTWTPEFIWPLKTTFGVEVGCHVELSCIVTVLVKRCLAWWDFYLSPIDFVSIIISWHCFIECKKLDVLLALHREHTARMLILYFSKNALNLDFIRPRQTRSWTSWSLDIFSSVISLLNLGREEIYLSDFL